MVNPDTIRTILGMIGNITSFVMFTHPFPIIRWILNKKSVGRYKFLPFLGVMINCGLWTIYSFVHPHSILVTTINIIGLVLHMFYIFVYCTYDTDRMRKLSMVAFHTLAFLSLFLVITVFSFNDHTSQSTFVGIFCDVWAFNLSTSHVYIMSTVIKSKNANFISLKLTLAAFLNGAVWSAYALIRFDIYILIGNAIGAIMNAMQLTTYACYYRSTTSQVKCEPTKPSQVQHEPSEPSQVQHEPSEPSPVQVESTEPFQVQPESLESSQVQLESTDQSLV